MAKGNIAKENLINKIIETLGDAYIGLYDKKYYFSIPDGGEKVQIAISLTCPKNPIVVDKTAMVDDGDWDFSDTPKATTLAVAPTGPAEITEDEKNNIAALMERLGL